MTVTVTVPGGHSSTPPDHTAIGFLAQIIRLIEDHPFKSQLIRNNPTLTYLRQAALYSKKMPEDLRQAIIGGQGSKRLLEYMDGDRERRAMIRTSTAVDVIQGGDKGELLTISIHELRSNIVVSQFSPRECQHSGQPPHRDPRLCAGC